MTEQDTKPIEQRPKKMLLELPIEYLNTFNKFKIEHNSDIRRNFYKSSQHETFKFILRDYLRIMEVDEYKNLPVEIENNKIENTTTFLKLEFENKKILELMAKKYNMNNNELIKESLRFFDNIMEMRKKKENQIKNNLGS